MAERRRKAAPRARPAAVHGDHGKGCRWCTSCSGAAACCVAWDVTGSPYAAGDDVRLMIKVLNFTRCTPAELVRLRREDVYLDEDRIWIRPEAGTEQRFVPISPCFKADLVSYLNHTNTKFLFENKARAPYTPATIRRLIKAVA